MAAYIIRRLWQMIPTMLGVALLVRRLAGWRRSPTALHA